MLLSDIAPNLGKSVDSNLWDYTKKIRATLPFFQTVAFPVARHFPCDKFVSHKPSKKRAVKTTPRQKKTKTKQKKRARCPKFLFVSRRVRALGHTLSFGLSAFCRRFPRTRVRAYSGLYEFCGFWDWRVRRKKVIVVRGFGEEILFSIILWDLVFNFSCLKFETRVYFSNWHFSKWFFAYPVTSNHTISLLEKV